MSKRNIENEKNYYKVTKALNEYFNDDSEYDYFNKLYHEIKTKYLKKIENGNFDIKVERARLESNAGNFAGNVTIFSANMLILAMTLLGTGLLQAYSLIKTSYASIFVIILAFIIFASIVVRVVRDHKSRDIDFIAHFCLQVLEDIEKEIESSNKKAVICDEVAATVQQEVQSSEQVRPNSNQTNGNWNVEINMPSIFDTVVSAYKVGKFVKKIFTKKRNLDYGKRFNE